MEPLQFLFVSKFFEYQMDGLLTPQYTEAHTKIRLTTPVLRILNLLISFGRGTIVIGRVIIGLIGRVELVQFIR